MALTLGDGEQRNGQEIIIERPDSSRRRVAAYPKLLVDAEGNIAGAVNMLQDVTDRREFEEKAAYMTGIVSSSDDAIISKTLNGIVTSWNYSAQRIFGYTAEEMIGEHILKLIPMDRKEEEPKILGRLRKGERVDHFETKRVTKDGRLLDISLTISPIKDSSGVIIGVSKVARDITAQKAAERIIRENEARFRMAVAATKLGTWEYTPASGGLFWSDECRSIYQIPADAPIDFKLFTRLLHPDDAPHAQSAITRAMESGSGGDYDIQFRILRFSDRLTRWIRSQGKVFFDSAGNVEKFIGTVLDITDDKLAKEELERKVYERTKDLKEANQKLALSNTELEQFAFVASHDLQEPLRKIQAFGDMLHARASGELGSEATDIIRRMQSASLRMKTLIDSLLSFSRVSTKKEELEHVNLSHLVDEVLADLETSIREKSATIRIGRLHPVKGQPMHLRQLFQNVIGNALKFSKAHIPSEINISSELVNGAASGIDVLNGARQQMFQKIEIKDNGIGFEPEYSGKIFHLFQRLHGRSEYPGSGMGLSIVQKVVHNHGGYIKAISSPGQGASFQILLPVEMD